jgi:hypothetical protein
VTCHRRAIFQLVEGLVVYGRFGLQIQHNYWHAGPLHNWQNCIRERIRGDIEKQNVDVFAAALVTGLLRALSGIDQAQIDHFQAGAGKPRPYLRHVSLKPLPQSGELRPIRIEANPAQANT